LSLRIAHSKCKCAIKNQCGKEHYNIFVDEENKVEIYHHGADKNCDQTFCHGFLKIHEMITSKVTT
jgi:hypothetical protein